MKYKPWTGSLPTAKATQTADSTKTDAPSRSVNPKLYYNNTQVFSSVTSQASKCLEIKKKTVRCPGTKSIKVHCVFRGKALSSSSFFSACGSSSLNILMNGCRYIRLAPLHVTSAGTYGIILAWLNWSAACGSGVDGVRGEVSHTAACIKTGNFNYSDTDQMGTVLKYENLMNLPLFCEVLKINLANIKFYTYVEFQN